MGVCFSCCEDDRADLDYYRRNQAPYSAPVQPNLYSNDNSYYCIRSTTSQVIRSVPVAPRSYQAPRSRSCTRSVPKRDAYGPRSRSCTRAVVAKRSEPKPEPLYGEFKCSCGRFWRSLLSWRDEYQICKSCKTNVYPTNQRQVIDTDRTRDVEDVGEHPKELCQKCKKLGHYCGRRG